MNDEVCGPCSRKASGTSGPADDYHEARGQLEAWCSGFGDNSGHRPVRAVLDQMEAAVRADERSKMKAGLRKFAGQALDEAVARVMDYDL